MSEDATVEIDVCYNDYWIEVYTLDLQKLEGLIQILASDGIKSFMIDDKTFYKRDLNSVSIVNHGLGFMFMDVND